jgi:carbohydrate 6-sulfotransferase 6
LNEEVIKEGVRRALANLNKEFGNHGLEAPSADQLEGDINQVLLVTSWRSGSTFLGEVLSATPGAFYTYEPLVYYDKVPAERGEAFYPRSYMVADLLGCEFKQILLDVAKDPNNAYIWRKNPSLVGACRGMRGTCTNAAFANAICQLHPLRVVKTVRFRLAEAKALLTEKTVITFLNMSALFNKKMT